VRNNTGVTYDTGKKYARIKQLKQQMRRKRRGGQYSAYNPHRAARGRLQLMQSIARKKELRRAGVKKRKTTLWKGEQRTGGGGQKSPKRMAGELEKGTRDLQGYAKP